MSRYSLDDSGPVNPRKTSSQPPLRCEGCGQTVTAYNSAAWNAGVCDRCQPANDNPELARLLRMQANETPKKGEAA